MRLYAANVSQQAVDLHFRMPENARMLHQLIRSGGQEAIAGDKLTGQQIAAIIEQNEKYGMVHVKDLSGYEGMQVTVIFSDTHPVSSELIDLTMAGNEGRLTEEGKRRRAELAIVAMNMLGEKNAQAGVSAQISVEEESPGTISREKGSLLSEGWAGPESDAARKTGRQPPDKLPSALRRRN